MAEDSRRHLLVVDDDATYRARLLRAFADRGLDARGAANAPEAIALAQQDSPELAVVDLKMPGPSGLELVAALKAIDPTTNVVVVTGYGSIATALEAVRLGATHYLTKPCDADEILAAFDRGSDSPKEPPAAGDIEAPSLARAEWEHIHRVLTDCGGNISEAARRLGLHRRSLQRKISKYPTAR
ncbi:MAG: response regulator [Myxococcales bacterium]|nr:response regulator [Myxococcales bacterium]MBL0198029.1 response regulator [Myxococcales bacterium]HQY61258.1 response regulator [Polyangiaceae bacterium]